MAKRWLAVRRNEAVTEPPLGEASDLGRGAASRASPEREGSPWRCPRVSCPAGRTYPRVAFRPGAFQAMSAEPLTHAALRRVALTESVLSRSEERRVGKECR